MSKLNKLNRKSKTFFTCIGVDKNSIVNDTEIQKETIFNKIIEDLSGVRVGNKFLSKGTENLFEQERKFEGNKYSKFISFFINSSLKV